VVVGFGGDMFKYIGDRLKCRYAVKTISPDLRFIQMGLNSDMLKPNRLCLWCTQLTFQMPFAICKQAESTIRHSKFAAVFALPLERLDSKLFCLECYYLCLKKKEADNNVKS
jgi:hypothetical protein